MENKTVRVNINISPKVKKWFEQRSMETGISQSGLMSIAISDYMDQKETIRTMGSLSVCMDKLDSIISEFDEIKKFVDK